MKHSLTALVCSFGVVGLALAEARAIGKAKLVADFFAKHDVELARHALRNARRGDSSRLRDTDTCRQTSTHRQGDFGQLCRFPRTSVTRDDHHGMIMNGMRNGLNMRSYRQLFGKSYRPVRSQSFHSRGRIAPREQVREVSSVRFGKFVVLGCHPVEKGRIPRRPRGKTTPYSLGQLDVTPPQKNLEPTMFDPCRCCERIPFSASQDKRLLTQVIVARGRTSVGHEHTSSIVWTEIRAPRRKTLACRNTPYRKTSRAWHEPLRPQSVAQKFPPATTHRPCSYKRGSTICLYL